MKKREIQNTYIMNTKKVLKKYNDEVVKVKLQGVQSDLEGQLQGLDVKVQGQLEGVNAELQTKETIANVDLKVAGAKGEAIETAKGYTDSEIAKIDGKLNASKEELQGVITAVQGNLEGSLEEVEGILTGKVSDLEEKVGEDVAELKAYVDTKDGEVLAGAKAYVDEKALELSGKVAEVEAKVDAETVRVNGEISRVEGVIAGVDAKVDKNAEEIELVKSAVSGKNNNTVVVETIDEIVIANPSPKTGDMAYVLDIKKSFIYVGGDFASRDLPTPPQGWRYFDEISVGDIDLVDYLKKAEAQVKFDAIDGQIVAINEDLATRATKVELSTEIDTLNKKISDLTINGGDTSAELEAVKEDLAQTKNRVAVNEGAIAGHEERIATLEAKEGYQLTDSDVQDIIDFILA